MAKVIEKHLGFDIYPTDHRMTCKRYGFEWVVTASTFESIASWLLLNRLHNIASNHLGRYTSFPLHSYDKKYGRMNEYRFAIRWGRGEENNRLYFRTREDLDQVLMIDALTTRESDNETVG